jgi:hypothetical protein
MHTRTVHCIGNAGTQQQPRSISSRWILRGRRIAAVRGDLQCITLPCTGGRL